jgi:hypothetical protein
VKHFARLALVAAVFAAAPALADEKSEPTAEPVLERPTLRSVGAYWIVKGDDNKNAAVRVDYRKAGSNGAGGEWRQGPPLFRVEKGKHKDKEFGSKLKLPDDAWLFAGSVLFLEPDTAYELKLTLTDPDGGEASETLAARTIGEPVAPTDGPMLHVVPGDANPDGNAAGTGTKQDPYKGLAAAEKNAKPGDTFLLHAGVYTGPFKLNKNGEEGKPIVWRAAGDGEAILDCKGDAEKPPERGIEATGLSDRWFEDLTIRNATHAIVAHESGRFVLRRCTIRDVDFGLTATKNEKDNVTGYFVTDNVMVGPSTWPRTKGIEDARGVQLTGAGHVIAYNRISNFGDAIDTMPSPRCEAIDIHNNDVSELTDDGIETDYSQRNTRVFHNRLTNVFQGISTQPVYGGPVYIVRNTMYNVSVEPFKMHNSPSGALILHNTIVKAGIPQLVWTSAPISNIVSRNNLFVGTDGGEQKRGVIDFTPPAEDCDFDYDGFAGTGPFPFFLRWNDKKYATLEETKKKAPIYRHAVQVDPNAVFAARTRPPETDQKAISRDSVDLRLAPGSAAIDAGQPLPGVNDGYTGSAPDLGALEQGAELPQYGPRRK